MLLLATKGANIQASLGTHVEELGNHSLTIILQFHDPTHGGKWMHIVVLVSTLRHLRKENQEEDGSDDHKVRWLMKKTGSLLTVSGSLK